MEIISYHKLTALEGGTQVQKGMNFGIKPNYSILLMSVQPNAPYNDKMLNDGKIEYEGHDARKSDHYNVKQVDQPSITDKGTLTENGKFFQAAKEFKENKRKPEKIKVYRKLRKGIWVDMGFYKLIDGYKKNDGNRNVFKFILEPIIENSNFGGNVLDDLLHDRQIPGDVQLAVYQRDKGKCTQCDATDNLHFDHILPFSKGGSSKVVENIQLLCARHNLLKSDKFL